MPYCWRRVRIDTIQLEEGRDTIQLEEGRNTIQLEEGRRGGIPYSWRWVGGEGYNTVGGG